MPTAMGFICGATSGSGSGYSSGARLPEVTYRIPLSLAAGISKEFVFLRAGKSPYGNVQGLVRGPSGTVLARASAPLPVAYGTPQPTVLVVTPGPVALPRMAGLATPHGFPPPPASLHRASGDLHSSAAALGGFGAIAIDQADTSGLSPARPWPWKGTWRRAGRWWWPVAWTGKRGDGRFARRPIPLSSGRKLPRHPWPAWPACSVCDRRGRMTILAVLKDL